MRITTKQFQILSDINIALEFMTVVYDRENGSGDPFCEKIGYGKGSHRTFRKRDA